MESDAASLIGVSSSTNCKMKTLDCLKSGNHSKGGLRKAVQSGAKELIPKKFSSIPIPRSFRTWSREVRPMLVWQILELWLYKESNRKVPHERSQILHGDALMLTLNAEISDTGEEDKSRGEI